MSEQEILVEFRIVLAVLAAASVFAIWSFTRMHRLGKEARMDHRLMNQYRAHTGRDLEPYVDHSLPVTGSLDDPDSVNLDTNRLPTP